MSNLGPIGRVLHEGVSLRHIDPEGRPLIEVEEALGLLLAREGSKLGVEGAAQLAAIGIEEGLLIDSVDLLDQGGGGALELIHDAQALPGHAGGDHVQAHLAAVIGIQPLLGQGLALALGQLLEGLGELSLSHRWRLGA